jgi:membrane protease YdiL (CAAX protease family)
LAVAGGIVAGALGVASIASVPLLSGAVTETSISPETLLSVAVAGQAAFALVGYLYVRRYLPETVCRRPTREEGRLILAGVAVTTALAFGLEALGRAAGFAPMLSLIEEVAATDPTVLLAMALVSLVAVGPAEELLFRGAIQNRLGRTFGPLAAITVTSLLFTLVHSNNYDASLVTVGLAMAIIFGVSSVLGVLYERTDNLAVPILVHGLYDAVVFLVLYGSAVGWI